MLIPIRFRKKIVLGLFVLLSAPSAKAGILFWADNNLNTIERSVDGAAPQAILTNDTFFLLATDSVHNWLYYTTGASDSYLYRSRFDGSGAQLIDSFDKLDFVYGLAIDPVGGKIFLSTHDGYSEDNGKIRCANLDGTGVQDLITNISAPFGMTFDAVHGKIFWSQVLTGSIQSANLDGSHVSTVVSNLNSPQAVAVNTKLSKVYWADRGLGIREIQRANLDGSNVEAIVAYNQFGDGEALATDPANGQIFWGDTFQHVLYTAGADGSNPHVLFGSDIVSGPTGIAFVPEPAAALILVCCAIFPLAHGYRGGHNQR